MFPFALPDKDAIPLAELHRVGEPVRFLLVGGMNCERRKQATKVITAFRNAFRGPSQHLANLTVLCQGRDLPAVRSLPSNIRLVTQHLTYTEVLQEYAEHHVVVMCSRAEGIGISTHEAIRARCAVLTLDSEMFKEIIANGVNGWLNRSYFEPGTVGARQLGNDQPIIRTHTFDPASLQALFTIIVQQGAVAEMQEGARRTYEVIFDTTRVISAMADALRT